MCAPLAGRVLLVGVLAVIGACGPHAPSTRPASRPTATRAAPSYIAVPAHVPAPGVLVLHSWWGLDRDMKAYADRLAAAGFVALVPDLYGDGRTASTISAAAALAADHSDVALAGRALAGLTALLRRDDVSGDKAGVVGFSLGGGAAAMLATQLAPQRVSALVLYYDARPTLPWDALRAPVLNNYAAHDAYNSPDTVATTLAAMKAAGADVRSYVYRGTQHWFAEPSRPQYRRPPAALAFRRTVRFLRATV